MRSERLSLYSSISFYTVLLLIFLYRFQTFDDLPQNHLVNHIVPNKKAVIIGTIVSKPEKFPKKTRLILESEKLISNSKTIAISGKVRITIYERKVSYEYGDRIKIENIRLRRPRNFKNKGAFDYETYLKNKDIYVTGSVGKQSRIEVIDKNNGFLLLKWIYQFKGKMLNSLDSSMPEENSAIVKAMVLGEKGRLSKEDKEAFTISGTAHLMAVSGLHIGFVALVSFGLIRKLTGPLMANFFMEKALSGWIIPVSALLTTMPVIFYMILVGWKSSSVRAGVMAIVYLCAVALFRQKNIYRSILIAAFIILIWKPLSFTDIGFQLSFIAVLSIVFCYREFLFKKEANNKIPIKKNKIKKIVIGNILINLFATLGTAPLIFYYFNRVTPYGFFANIFAVPLAALIIPGAMISMMIFPVFHWPGILGLKIISLLTSILMLVVNFFSVLPMASLRFSTPSVIFVVSLYLFLFLLIKRKWVDRSQRVLIIIGGILIFSLFLNYLSPSEKEKLKVTFIDVGQGEAILVELPGGENMLIDGGGLFGDFDIGESVLAPYLWDHGVEKIDYIIPTHSDNDHIEGLFYLLKEMKTGVLWTNSLIPFKTNLTYLEELARRKNAPVMDINSLYKMRKGEVLIEKLHPTKEFNSIYFDKKENNYSMVLKLTYGAISFLFTSDIEKEAEEFLTRKYGDKLRSTILKVPHHGSSTSSAYGFIDKVKPETAVISAGLWNRFKHPSKQTIERYKNNNVKIFRTDLHGAITITTDGKDYEVKTFIK